MDTKKISFGFKLQAKPTVLPVKQTKDDTKVVKELIKCLEGQEIKLVAEKKEEAPLIIPMLTNQKTSTALASLMKRRAVLLGEDENDDLDQNNTQNKVQELITPATGNLDDRAARELLAEVSAANGEHGNEQEKLVLPVLKPDELPLDGAKQSSIDDYDAVPIQQFGLAMLRGMGWVEPPKKKGGPPIDEAPFVRPKGMGLGADKALKSKPLLVQPEKNELLEIKKQAYVRILGGKHKDAYGQIEGFDDHAGRVIVKMAIGGAKEAFNEFMCQPVPKKEFAQYGKCINTAKYAEYKKLENEHGQIIVKSESNVKINIKNERFAENESKYNSSRKTEDERKYYKDEHERGSKTYKDESRGGKSYKSESHESKSYKDEFRESKSYKDDNFREKKPYKEEKNVYREEKYKNEPRSDFSRHEQRNSKYNIDKTRQEYSSSNRRIDYEKSSTSRSKHRSRSPTRYKSEKSSSRRHSSSKEESATESDTDSEHERKHKKKKSKKHKSKKSKRKSSESNTDSSSEDEQSERRKKHKQKKTKKNKHARSRSRSRGRR